MRPSDYTEDLADEICRLIAEGQTIKQICAVEGMPDKAQIFRWLTKADFRDKYERARVLQAEHMAEELLEIVDDGTNDTQRDEDGKVIIDHDHIARSRLRFDARKWLMSKMAPKKYGDQMKVAHSADASLTGLLGALDGVTRGIPGGSKSED